MMLRLTYGINEACAGSSGSSEEVKIRIARCVSDPCGCRWSVVLSQSASGENPRNTKRLGADPLNLLNLLKILEM